MARRFLALGLCVSAAVFLAGCAGVSGSSSTSPPPPPESFDLSVQPGGDGTGSVTSNPSGINCGSACSADFKAGTQVTLIASAGENSTFGGWGNACSGDGKCVVTVNANSSVSATFNKIQVSKPTVTVTLAGNGSGTVTSNPPGINCGTTCNATFSSGQKVTLTETVGAPNTFSAFTGWGGACSGNTSSCTLTLTNNVQVSANFNPAINHIVIAVQENRSFDHYFGELRQYWKDNGYPDQSFDGLPQFNPTSGQPPLYGPPPTNPGCNPNSPPPDHCSFDPNNPITSFHLITQCVERPVSVWNQSHYDWDFYDPTGQKPATLNGNVWNAAQTGRHQKFYDTDGIRAMGYYVGGTPDQVGDLNYYYFMASNFGTSDRWFTPVMTRTNSNREYLVAATSQGYVFPVGSNSKDKNLLTAQTIFQALEAAGISWKIYVNPTNSNCTGPPYDPHCLLTLSYIQSFSWGQTIPDDYPNNIGTIQDYANDLANGTLPQVVEFEPAADAGWDEHPSDFDSRPSDIQRGANYMATQIIGPLMSSQYWKDSAVVLTYDEFGGFYDHVPPQPTVSPDGIPPSDLEPGDVCTKGTGPLCDFTYTGYRVPMIVVSPYSKKNYVSHTVADTTAILKMIEARFHLPALTKRDAAQMDMTEFFDFTTATWMTPPAPPSQNLNGPCYVNKLP